MLGNERKVLSGPPKRQILTAVLQNCEKSAVKGSIEKRMSLDFVNCLQYFVQDCSHL